MRILRLLIIFLALSLAAVPAQALTFDSLKLEVSENGDTLAVFDYTMTFWEYIGYYTKIASPADEIRKELDKRTDQPVDIIDVSDKKASFMVYEFTKVSDDSGKKTYTVPPMQFSKAEEYLNDHWLSKITDFDLSPEVAEIVFPDGYSQKYYNQADIPATVHAI